MRTEGNICLRKIVRGPRRGRGELDNLEQKCYNKNRVRKTRRGDDSIEANIGTASARSGAKPRAAGEVKLKRRIGRLTKTALDALESILADDGAKAADRISAAKLAFELARQSSDRPDPEDGVVRVIFEGAEKELAE